jgi:hypothetical protein
MIGTMLPIVASVWMLAGGLALLVASHNGRRDDLNFPSPDSLIRVRNGLYVYVCAFDGWGEEGMFAQTNTRVITTLSPHRYYSGLSVVRDYSLFFLSYRLAPHMKKCVQTLLLEFREQHLGR